VHCSSAHIHQVGADAALEGVQPLVRFRYTFPSRLPGPSRLAMPTRPVVVGAAPARILRFQDQAAPSFSDPLRRATVGSLIPLGQSTPRGALRAQSATGQVAGAATEKPGLNRPSSKNRPAQHAFSQKPLVPVDRTQAGHRTTQKPSKRSFMPREACALGLPRPGRAPEPVRGSVAPARTGLASPHTEAAPPKAMRHGVLRHPPRPADAAPAPSPRSSAMRTCRAGTDSRCRAASSHVYGIRAARVRAFGWRYARPLSRARSP
jgi:hypothetical protein